MTYDPKRHERYVARADKHEREMRRLREIAYQEGRKRFRDVELTLDRARRDEKRARQALDRTVARATKLVDDARERLRNAQASTTAASDACQVAYRGGR